MDFRLRNEDGAKSLKAFRQLGAAAKIPPPGRTTPDRTSVSDEWNRQVMQGPSTGKCCF